MKITKQLLREIIEEEVSSILSEDKRIDKGVIPIQFKVSILYPPAGPDHVDPPSNDIIFIDYYNNKNTMFMQNFNNEFKESGGPVPKLAYFVTKPKMKPKALHPRTIKRIHSMVEAVLSKNKARVISSGQLMSLLKKKGLSVRKITSDYWLAEKLGIAIVSIEHQ
jgi:hypothetical protein